jgi:hypothetical protein
VFLSAKHYYPTTCAGGERAHRLSPMEKRCAHYGLLVRQAIGCFLKPPTHTTQPAQRIDLRTAIRQWEGGMRTIGCWLAKVKDVYQMHPPSPTRLRRRPT